MAQLKLRTITFLTLLALPAIASAQTNSNQSRDPAAAPGSGAMAPGSAAMAPGKDDWSDRSRMKAVAGEKEMLQQALSAGKSREEYRSILQKNDYMITSINEDSDDELEMEVVRGDHSFEVQFDFEGPGAAKEIDVSMNAWRADSTKQAMDDKSFNPGNVVYDRNNARARDQANMTSADNETDRLEALMKPGDKVAAYRTLLEREGYKITSVNESDPANAEYEIVKGQQSYEVQLDIDESTQNVTEADVSVNIWQSKETEDALGQN